MVNTTFVNKNIRVYGNKLILEEGFYTQPLTAFDVNNKLVDKKRVKYMITTRTEKPDTFKDFLSCSCDSPKTRGRWPRTSPTP